MANNRNTFDWLQHVATAGPMVVPQVEIQRSGTKFDRAGDLSRLYPAAAPLLAHSERSGPRSVMRTTQPPSRPGTDDRGRFKACATRPSLETVAVSRPARNARRRMAINARLISITSVGSVAIAVAGRRIGTNQAT